LWRLPEILVVHLKRFCYKNGKSYREKIESFIHYPIEGLDLSKYLKAETKENVIYDLYAVSLHFGSLGGGHYTASCKNFKTGKWYKFDDSTVNQENDQQKLQQSAAYLLFYEKRKTNNNNENTATTTNHLQSEDIKPQDKHI